MTGGFDAHDKVWRGLLQVLMDPQRFANKFFSQTLHIINSNAKGGLLAEATAFADPVKAEQDWANPSALDPAGGRRAVGRQAPHPGAQPAQLCPRARS